MKRIIFILALLATSSEAFASWPGSGRPYPGGPVTPPPILGGATIYGSAPAVAGTPMHQIGSAAVATISNTGGTPTSCDITAGDSGGNFRCIVSSGTVRIVYTLTGAINLNGVSDLITQTLTVTATNGGGTSPGVSVPVNVYADGALQAPVATPQFPSAFSGYATRPPWLVAGVDYFAGRDPAFSLTSAGSVSVPGCTVNSGASPPNITCIGSNKILDKVNFKTSNGYVVNFNGCTNCGITNSDLGGTNYANPPLTSTIIIRTDTSSPGFIFTGNDFDGGCPTSAGSSGSQLFIQGGGATIYRRNYSHRRSQHVMDFSTNSGILTREWNLIEGGGCASGGHANVLQWGGGTAIPTVRFETFNWGPNTYLGLQSEVYQFYQFNPGTMAGPTLKYGTIIVPSTANPGISYATNWWASGTTTRSGTMTMSNMYMDMGGNAGVCAFGSLYRNGACSNMAPTSITGNIDLNTGGSLLIGDVGTNGC